MPKLRSGVVVEASAGREQRKPARPSPATRAAVRRTRTPAAIPAAISKQKKGSKAAVASNLKTGTVGKRRKRDAIEVASSSLALLPAVLVDKILTGTGFQGCCRVAQCCKSLRETAASESIWTQLLANRHAQLGTGGVDPKTCPGGPVRGRSYPPYSEESNAGARSLWLADLAQLKKAMPAKAKYRELHSRGLPLPSCGCNVFYRGYVCPRGEYDICAQKVVEACGVSGCAACFCSECTSGSHVGLDTDFFHDAAGNQPTRMERCRACGVTVCRAHQRDGLMQRRAGRDGYVCVDCATYEGPRPSSGVGAASKRQRASGMSEHHEEDSEESEYDGGDGSSYGMPDSLMGDPDGESWDDEDSY